MFAATAALCVSWTVSIQTFFFSTFVRFAEDFISARALA
jgi:hypothetical protein